MAQMNNQLPGPERLVSTSISRETPRCLFPRGLKGVFLTMSASRKKICWLTLAENTAFEIHMAWKNPRLFHR